MKKKLLDARKAEAMPVQVIAWLLIAVFSVIVAVALFVKIWNVFLGSNTIDEDAGRLAATISKMLDDERPYLQEAAIILLDDKGMVGFEKGTANLQIESQVWSATLTRPDKCKDEMCICVVDDGDEVGKCHNIRTKIEGPVHLISDYTGYQIGLSGKAGPFPPRVPAASDIKVDSYTIFFINKDLFRRIQTAQGRYTDTEETKAIIPVLIEKITVGNDRYITILPDTDRSRSREYYAHVCVEGSEAGCVGKTPFESLHLKDTSLGWNVEGNLEYCEPNILKDPQICSQTTMPACVDGKEITRPCVCGQLVGLYGFCIAETIQPIICEAASSCDDYCKQDTQNTCTDIEIAVCNVNPCHIKNCAGGANEKQELSCIDASSLGVNCQEITSCESYCGHNTASSVSLIAEDQARIEEQADAVCDGDEVRHCNLDPCNKGCVFTQTDTRDLPLFAPVAIGTCTAISAPS